MQCPGCGTTVGPSDAWCPSCGASLADVARTAAPPAQAAPTTGGSRDEAVAQVVPPPYVESGRTCPACGFPAAEDLATCWACGASLSGAGRAEPTSRTTTVAPASEFYGLTGQKEEPDGPRGAAAAVIDSPRPQPEDGASKENHEEGVEAAFEVPPGLFVKPVGSTPVGVPTVVTPAAARSSSSVARIAVPAIVLLAGVVAVASYLLSDKRAILSRVSRGQLVTPVGDSAYDRFLEYERGRPGTSAIAQIANAAVPPLEGRGEEILRRLKDENLESEAEWGEAVRIFDWLNRLRPQSNYLARLHFSQARVRFIKGENTTAMNDYQQAIAADPSWALPLNGLARIYIRMQDRAMAQHYYRRATETEPGWIYPWINLGVTSYELKDLSTSEWALNRALSIDGTKASAHYYLARTLEDWRRPCDAVSHYRSAVDNAYRSNSPGFSIDAARNRITRLTNRYGCQ